VLKLKNYQRLFLITALLFLFLVLLPNVNAAVITSCTVDRSIYYQNESGYISLTVYNDLNDKIRVYEITATIDYFYTDGTRYLQIFQTNATLPVEISQGESETFYIPFSLPSNIAPGYVRFSVKAKTELWNSVVERWIQSDSPTAEPVIYIESPYKQKYQQQLTVNEQLQQQVNQLQEQLTNLQTAYNNLTLMAYMLIAMVIALGLTIAILMKYLRKPVVLPPSQP